MAATTPLQFFATATSVGGDSVAQVLIPTAGRIAALNMSFRSASGAAAARLEVSLQSTNQFTTNDARNVLFNWGGYQDASQYLNNPTWFIMDVPVTEMDRVYVHLSCTSALWLLVGNIWLRH